jgi:alpha-ketoglutarate-dependent 2,4-dichlorophenoxyacetate dioxygenase
MSITVRPLHPVFVAQIAGVDLREPLDNAAVAAIEDAINQYGVLVFPSQFIDDRQQMAFSSRFGELETSVKLYRKDYVPRLDPHVSDISNLDKKNRIRARDDRLRPNGLGNRLWHSDSSFKRIPARFRCCPPGRSLQRAGKLSLPICARRGTPCRNGKRPGWRE